MRSCVAVLALAIAGCTSEVGPEVAERAEVLQSRFVFTRVADRALFQLVDLEFRADLSAADYAAFRVTGPQPRLLGPRSIVRDRGAGAAMLCAATGYFSNDGGAKPLRMTLLADDVPLVEAAAAPMGLGGCAMPTDQFSVRVPLPNGDKPGLGEAVDIVLVAGEEEGAPAGPPLDSVVYLRSVDINEGEMVHNVGQHALQGVGYDGDSGYVCGTAQ